MEDCSRIPANCIISGILRKSEVVLPRGATVNEIATRLRCSQ